MSISGGGQVNGNQGAGNASNLSPAELEAQQKAQQKAQEEAQRQAEQESLTSGLNGSGNDGKTGTEASGTGSNPFVTVNGKTADGKNSGISITFNTFSTTDRTESAGSNLTTGIGSGNFDGTSIFGNGTYSNGSFDVDMQTLNDLSNKFYNFTVNAGNMPFGMGSAAMQNSIGNWFQAFMNCFKITDSTVTTDTTIQQTTNDGVTSSTTQDSQTQQSQQSEQSQQSQQTPDAPEAQPSSTPVADTTATTPAQIEQVQQSQQQSSEVTAPQQSASEPKKSTTSASSSTPKKEHVPGGYEATDKKGVYKLSGKNEYYKYNSKGYLQRCNKDGSAFVSSSKTADSSKNLSDANSKDYEKDGLKDSGSTGVPKGYTATTVKGVYIKDGKYYKYNDDSELLTRCTKTGGVYVDMSKSNGYEVFNDKLGVYRKDGKYYKYDKNQNRIECNKDGCDPSYKTTRYLGLYTKDGEFYVLGKDKNPVKIPSAQANKMIKEGKLALDTRK